MKRKFLKNNQYEQTQTCYIGKDFTGNGHWLIHIRCASNRRHFDIDDLSKAEKFVKNTPHIIPRHSTFDEIIEDLVKDDPLEPAIFSDICIGEAALIKIGSKLRAVKAEYLNILKEIWGPTDLLLGNEKCIIAMTEKNEPGLVIALYDIGDLRTSIRNIEISKAILEHLSHP